MNETGDHTRDERADGDRDGFELRHFERNRYFQGKLLTALDLLTEQRYHADRLSAVSRLIGGSGIVAGLAPAEFEVDDGTLRVTVEPGFAIDPTGRPIVVRSPTTRSFPIPDGDELFVYLRYEEETKDPVPVPGADPLGGEVSEESRVLEVFELLARETAADVEKSTPAVEFPDLADADGSLDDVADEIASRYHESHRDEVATDDDTGVLLCSFARTKEGTWRLDTDRSRRPFAYDNDMLFALFVNHVADTDNPHHTRVGEPTEYIENEIGQIPEFAVALREVEANVDALADTIDAQREYITHKSLKTTSRFFDAVSAEFQTHGDVSRTALRIVDAAREAIDGEAYEEPPTFVAFAERVLPDAEHLEETIEGITTDDSYDGYADAVDDLRETLADDPSVMDVAVGLDRLAERAEMLEQRYGVVPDG